MPPAGAPRPDEQAYSALVASLETELDRLAAASPNPGKPAVHRLNRVEYTNAVRDLLDLDINGESFLPPDDSNYGFDNIGEVLTTSPMLFDRYMSAARKISRLALGDTSLPPSFETYDVPKYLMQDGRMSEDLPFGSRGGIAVRHYFPLDGEYVLKIRLQRNVYAETIIGLAAPNQMEVRLDRARIGSVTVGGEYKGDRASLYDKASPEEYAYLFEADEGLEVKFSAKAGMHVVGIAFVGNEISESEPEGVYQPDLPEFRFVQSSERDLPAISSIIIGGPFSSPGPGDTASRRRIFVCRPAGPEEHEPCAEKILAVLARRAYRRPVSDDDVSRLLNLYRTAQREQGFEAGIEVALQKILVSPEFLFRIERDPADAGPGAAYPISDIDLASRLSFFLWSSIPDDELLSLAEHRELREPAVLEQQVRRMLSDRRSESLIDNFAGQWLHLRNLRAASPDLATFPEFDENLREAFLQETEFFFGSMLRDDRPVTDLLTADYTFLNDRLAQHYGIPGIYGSHFRRVSLSDENRWGLLGQGSILTVTSYANRTSPVTRGKWLLDNFLGTPPPPPPPDVTPALKSREDDGRVLSMRQRMEQHRANPACATCHSRMDPLGFALENFDAVGAWRSSDTGVAIDASGALPDGTRFEGPTGLRNALLRNREEFVSTVTEKLLTYALGRPLEYYDFAAVRGILRGAASTNYRWSPIILGVVESTPFQMRRSREP
jgi:hypothetical protein